MRKSVTGDLGSCFTVTWHRDKVIIKLVSMTRWSRSFSLWQGDHGASPWLSTLLQRHDHQHFSSKLGKICMDSRGNVCVCVCLQIIYWPFSFPLCNWVYTDGTSSGMLVLKADQLWWWWWWWWWWWYTKDQIQKIEGFEIAITIPHQQSWRWVWAFLVITISNGIFITNPSIFLDLFQLDMFLFFF